MEKRAQVDRNRQRASRKQLTLVDIGENMKCNCSSGKGPSPPAQAMGPRGLTYIETHHEPQRHWQWVIGRREDDKCDRRIAQNKTQRTCLSAGTDGGGRWRRYGGTWVGAVFLHRLDSLNASNNLPKEQKKDPPPPSI